MDTEDEIIEQLKKICDKNGKEKFPKQSAKLFYKLGLIYKTKGLQQADKIKLIQSSALLNASIVRKPENLENIKRDLRQFCSELLKAANAANQEADLNIYSNRIAKDVADMRNKVSNILITIPQIPEDISDEEFTKLKNQKLKSIGNLQNIIRENYIKIMKHLAGFCEEIMGNPSCEYSLIGLGSISRREITPYSDFENVIVLNDNITELLEIQQKKVKEYFRWFAVIFQIILINLGETILPAVYISSLNSGDLTKFNFYDAVTPMGISFDGMMPHACKSPLGRQVETKNKQFTLELIQNVSKMASFVGSDENIKNGYHLADMLMTSCFIAGNQLLYQQFQKNVDKEKLLLNIMQYRLSVEEQINKNRKDFDVINQLNNLRGCKNLYIKRMVYRSSTLFVSAIGKIYGIKNACCFDILESLIQDNKLTKEVGCDLKFAIAVACEVRLRIYMDKKSQDDTVQQSEIKIRFIDDTVGIKSLVEYFLNIITFQRNLFDLNKIEKPEIVLVPAICYVLSSYAFAIKWWNRERCKTEFTNNSKKDVANCQYWIALCKYELGEYKEALTDFQTLLENYQQIDKNPPKDGKVSYHYYWIGSCNYKLGKFKEALTNFKTSLEIHQRIDDFPTKVTDIANNHFWIGSCNYELGQYKQALSDFQTSLEIYQQIDNDPIKSKYVAYRYYRIGMCKYQLSQFKEALFDFQTSLEIHQQIDDDPTKSSKIAYRYYRIGLCKYQLNQYKEAISDFQSSLVIHQQIDDDSTNSSKVAFRYYGIGLCKYELSQYKEALFNFKTSLTIYVQTGQHQEMIMKCQDWIGRL